MACLHVALLLVFCLFVTVSVAQREETSSPEIKATTSTQVDIEVLFKPTDCSETAASGDTVNLHYIAKFANGQSFDNSRQRDTPMEVQLGANKIIPGVEQGVIGMCVGEKRKIVIPPELAYGNKGVAGIIPPKSTLVFEMELMSMSKQSITDRIVPFMVTVSPGVILAIIVYVIYVKATEKKQKGKNPASFIKSKLK